jgi:hypothetical protein
VVVQQPGNGDRQTVAHGQTDRDSAISPTDHTRVPRDFLHLMGGTRKNPGEFPAFADC